MGSKVLSGRETGRFGRGYVQILQGLDKLEQLTMEMKLYRISILAVTHLPGKGEMVMIAEAVYSLLLYGRSDGTTIRQCVPEY